MTEKSKPDPGFRDVSVGARYATGWSNSTPEPAAMSRSGCARYRAAEINDQLSMSN